MPTRFGKYFVDDRIAIGGMAEIYRGHTSVGQPVAIKKILPQQAQDPKFVQMFLDEIRIANRLTHPNIVATYDFGKVEDTYFIVMEWIDGKPLSAILRRAMETGRMVPVEIAILIILDVCEGIGYAHSRADQFNRPLCIVHRDISPPNILLTRTAIAKLADFGIAAASHKSTQTQPGIIRGKFSYMSPEHSRGLALDGRADLFSLGVVLYEMLSLTRLFLRESEIQTIEAVRKCKIPLMDQYRGDVSPRLQRVVAKALAPRAEDRYATAAMMSDDLYDVIRKEHAGANRARVAEFMKWLFPEEVFPGVSTSMEELNARWKQAGRLDKKDASGSGFWSSLWRRLPWRHSSDRSTP